ADPEGSSINQAGLEDKADAVPVQPDRPSLQGQLSAFARAALAPGHASVATMPGATIVDVFDAHDGQLLLLGEAGSGKSLLLLVLVQTLLDRADQDEAEPVPLVLSLVSWSPRRARLEDWLFDELIRPGLYEVPRDIARAWIADERILPLLDG